MGGLTAAPCSYRIQKLPPTYERNTAMQSEPGRAAQSPSMVADWMRQQLNQTKTTQECDRLSTEWSQYRDRAVIEGNQTLAKAYEAALDRLETRRRYLKSTQ